MKMIHFRSRSWFTLLLLLTFVNPIEAQVTADSPTSARDEEEGPFEMEFILLAATDFRYRGISYSDKRPVLQPEITVSHSSGLYVDLWASNIAEYNSARTEIDLSFGLEREVGPFVLDVGMTSSFFPGGTDTDFVELYALTETKLGPATMQLQTYYAPAQANIGDEDNFYVGIGGSLPLPETPVILHASFGIEDGAFGAGKRDWSIGASTRLMGFDLCARYVDTARARDPLASPGLVVLVSRTLVYPRREVAHQGCPSW
jgi:uncharacterized protein (TIGR02001 family)